MKTANETTNHKLPAAFVQRLMLAHLMNGWDILPAKRGFWLMGDGSMPSIHITEQTAEMPPPRCAA